jgi:hypothetical protein
MDDEIGAAVMFISNNWGTKDGRSLWLVIFFAAMLATYNYRPMSAAEVPSNANAHVLPEGELLKSTRRAAEQASSVLNILAGASSLIGALCSSSSPQCTKISLIVSGATWLGSGVANHVALEIANGDPDYAEIERPGPPALPQFSGSKQDAAAAAAARLAGLMYAIYKTANRATGASKAGNDFWTQKQMEALTSYQAQVKPQIDEFVAPLGAETDEQFDELKSALNSYRARSADLYAHVKDSAPGWAAFVTRWCADHVPYAISYYLGVVCR